MLRDQVASYRHDLTSFAFTLASPLMSLRLPMNVRSLPSCVRLPVIYSRYMGIALIIDDAAEALLQALSSLYRRAVVATSRRVESVARATLSGRQRIGSDMCS